MVNDQRFVMSNCLVSGRIHSCKWVSYPKNLLNSHDPPNALLVIVSKYFSIWFSIDANV